MFKRLDLGIINRSFWPGNQVIGEALLQFAEEAAKKHSVGVVTQYSGNLEQIMALNERGEGVHFKCCRNLTTSSSGVIVRMLEAFYFMIWVGLSLLLTRPRRVYIATDPPVVVPFIVFIYSKVFRAKYYYHLQDIHPEAANIVLPLNRAIFAFLKGIDNITIRGASKVITLTGSMQNILLKRASVAKTDVELLENPAIQIADNSTPLKREGVVFCGNAGRLQRIPMVVDSIEKYIGTGGKLRFTFIGAGVYSGLLEKLALKYEQVTYYGFLPAVQANKIVAQHSWALLPIDDEVTHYAFPSKSSSYVLSGCAILSVCDEETSVAKWVVENKLGLNAMPTESALVSTLFHIEQFDFTPTIPTALFKRLEIPSFVAKLLDIIF